MRKCKRFNVCNAMVCPLDPNWKSRAHLSGERVCIYLLVYFKEQGYADNIPVDVCRMLDFKAEDILAEFGIIRSQVCKSSLAPSKIQGFKDRRYQLQH